MFSKILNTFFIQLYHIYQYIFIQPYTKYQPYTKHSFKTRPGHRPGPVIGSRVRWVDPV
jgi:hypothetical protein